MDHDKIIQFIRSKGLVLPVQITSQINQPLLIAGAVLSELSSSGKIQISNTKIGGSPVYYVKEHTYKLTELYKHLNEKDKRAYDLIKQRKVLRDQILTPLLRVSLRNIKDFAKPVEVAVGENKELFWRWFMTPMNDAEPLIQNFFAKPKPPKEEKPKKEVKTEVQKPEPPKPVQKILEKEPVQDNLHEKTKKYFNSSNIVILDSEIIRKNSDIDYIIEIPTPIGKIKYYCKVKKTKKCNEGDIAQLFVKGQAKKLPAMLLTNGELTKKAKEALDTEYENLKFKKLG